MEIFGNPAGTACADFTNSCTLTRGKGSSSGVSALPSRPSNKVPRQFVGKSALPGFESLDYWNQTVNERAFTNEIKKMDAADKRALAEKPLAEVSGKAAEQRGRYPPIALAGSTDYLRGSCRPAAVRLEIKLPLGFFRPALRGRFSFARVGFDPTVKEGA